MEIIVRKHIARILKYLVVQQLGVEGEMLLLFFFFYNMLLVSVLVALSLLF